MNHNRGNRNKTGVKDLIVFSCVVVQLFSGTAWSKTTAAGASSVGKAASNAAKAVAKASATTTAADAIANSPATGPTPNAQTPAAATTPTPNPFAPNQFVAYCQTQQGLADPKCDQASCKDMLKDAQDAKAKINTACAEGSLGADCYKKAFTCAVAASDKTQDSSESYVNSLLTNLGISDTGASGGLASAAQAKCPQYSAQDYKDRKKDLEKAINDANKELATLQKELATAKKEGQDKMVEITKSIQKSQKEIKEKKNELKNEQREKEAAFAKEQENINNKLRQNKLAALDIQQAMVKASRDLSKNLLDIETSAAKAACMTPMQAKYDNYAAMVSTRSLSVSFRKSAMADINAAYKLCMRKMDDARKNFVEAHQATQAKSQEMLVQTQEESSQIQDSLAAAQGQLNDMKAQSIASEKDLDNELLQELQNSQTEMQAIQSNFADLQKSTLTQQNEINGRINAGQNELAALGPVPDADAKTGSAKVAPIIRGEITKVVSYSDSCCKEDRKNTEVCKDFAAITKTVNENDAASGRSATSLLDTLTDTITGSKKRPTATNSRGTASTGSSTPNPSNTSGTTSQTPSTVLGTSATGGAN